MARLTVRPKAPDDNKIPEFLADYARRIEATPPGICPVALQLDMLRSGGCQTCGKCTPCRQGIPQLAAILEDVVTFRANEDALDEMRDMALTIRDTADCAIGWHTANIFLEGLDVFHEEYQSHIANHSCQEGVSQTIPCETNCPAHVNIPAYIALIRDHDYAGAINMIRKDNPFPTACGYICEHPCEDRCRRILIDAPINIQGLKKFACDQVSSDEIETPTPAEPSGKRIAVVGAGPSGLTCAYFSALMGHEVHVFDARKQPGGMMRYGIPAYRLPREKLDNDIRAIQNSGNVELHLEEKIDAGAMRVLADKFDAVYVAIGAQGGKTVDLPGSDAQGVLSAVEMLTEIGDGNYPDFSSKDIVVIGGGNVAMDVARTSVRCGAENVTIVYRRRIDDMTARRDELESASREGVEILSLEAPESIEVDEAGHCTALLCQPQVIGMVKRGRPAPRAADKPLDKIPADVIIMAVGQDILSDPFEEFGIETNRSRLEADDELQAACEAPNVFVGGDCHIGPKTVIAAIGEGKVAARNIDDYLGFDHELPCDIKTPTPQPGIFDACGRVDIIERPARERKKDFDNTLIEMSFEEAMQESSRCLRCDFYGCGIVEGGRVQYE